MDNLEKNDLSWWQRLVLWLLGKVYLGHCQKPGWSGALPFYAVKCPKHGVYIDYPHGYNNYFTCPQCQDELVQFSKSIMTSAEEVTIHAKET